MPPATATQALAELLLGEDLEAYVGARRLAGLSWQAIVDDIRDATEGRVDIHRETLRLWAKNSFKRAKP